MSSNATRPPVRAEERSGVLVVTIDREEAGNSVSLGAAQAMRAAFRDVEGRTDLRGIIVTGAGERFFCSGGDLKAYSSISTKAELAATFGAVRDLLVEMEDHQLPVVAAINGYALGGGAELALACDMRFADKNARIGFPQSRLGLIPGWNGTERLVRTVGRSEAMRMLLTAQRLTAAQAASKGLVDEVSEGQSVLEHAVAFLAGLPAAPLAVSSVKRAVRAASQPAAGEATAAIFEKLWFTDDHREAEKAFAEKREPIFRGY
jgi:enoyl-CoA hydratase/carnithine racemase